MRAHSSASTFNAPQVNTDELEEGAVDAPLMKDWLDIIDNCIALRALLRALRSRGLAELFGALPHLCLASALYPIYTSMCTRLQQTLLSVHHM